MSTSSEVRNLAVTTDAVLAQEVIPALLFHLTQPRYRGLVGSIAGLLEIGVPEGFLRKQYETLAPPGWSGVGGEPPTWTELLAKARAKIEAKPG